MPWLLVLAACAPAAEEPKACPTDTPGTAACPNDACAQECGGVECCIATYGRGGLDERSLERLALYCEGESCDPDQYLSPAAALCAAQVHGLEAGLAECRVGFDGYDPFQWRVGAHVDLPCEEDWDREGTIHEYYLDAITGAFDVHTLLFYTAAAECPA